MIFLETIKKNLILLQNRKSFILLPIYGLGETTVCASLMKNLKEINPAKNVLLVKNKNYAEFVKHFEGVDDAIPIELNLLLKLFHEKFANKFIQKGQICPLNLKNFNLEEFEHANMFDSYKSFLFREKGIQVDFSNNFIINKTDETNIIEKYKLREKENIFIIPNSNALNCSCLKFNFWKNLIQSLNQLGYNVIVNSEKKCYGEATCIFDSIYNTILIANNCKYVISFRTGLIDAISATTYNPYIISYYPSIDYQIYNCAKNEQMVKVVNYKNKKGVNELDEGFSEYIIKIHSLKGMYKRSNCEELLVRKNNIDEILNRTLSIVKKKFKNYE